MKEKVNIILEKNTVLIICWLVVSLINLNKAYHIDDTFHLEAGTYIIDHLNTPMSGKINWDNSPTEMYWTCLQILETKLSYAAKF